MSVKPFSLKHMGSEPTPGLALAISPLT
jgi:hypothetical protein